MNSTRARSLIVRGGYTVLRPWVLALALLIVAVPLRAQADRPGLAEVGTNRREGFWVSFGLGGGGDRIKLVNDPLGLGYSDVETRVTSSLQVGGTVNEHWRLGAEYWSWYDNNTGSGSPASSWNINSALDFVARWYPSSRGGLYFKGGAGFGFDSFTSGLFGYSAGNGQTGFNVTGGIGYEIPLSRRVSIAPTVDVYQFWYGARFGNDAYRRQVLNIGVAVVWQAGRRF